MITRELLKNAIDKVPEGSLGVLYKIIKALEEPANEKESTFKWQNEWRAVIVVTYGSTGDVPLERVAIGTVHPEVVKISGLIPADVDLDARAEYRERALEKFW